MELERYHERGEPPLVLFVCSDADKAWQFARAADRAVTGRLGEGGQPEESWNHPGRKRLFFAAERDLHQGTLRVLKLPEWPPALRERLALRRGQAPAERSKLDFHQVGLLGGDELIAVRRQRSCSVGVRPWRVATIDDAAGQSRSSARRP